MNIVRTAIVAVPFILASSTAFAAPNGSSPQSTPESPPTTVPQSEPAPTQPPVSTTTTTSYAEPAEQAAVAPKRPAMHVEDRTSLEPLIGFGTNDYNFGIGGRLGYTFKVPVYVGGTFMWHHGDTQESIRVNGLNETRKTFWYPAGEVGYDIAVPRAPVMIRPYAGAGILRSYTRVTTSSTWASSTESEFLFYPGITARFEIPQTVAFVGVDTRLLVPVVHTNLSYQAFGSIGVNM